MKLLLLDNYDSFTYNLEYILRKYSNSIDVIRNDKIQAEDCLKYDVIVLSPGPGLPKDAGNMPEIVAQCAGKIPILGICLGHQCIAEYLGARLLNLNEVYHGKKTEIQIQNNELGIFKGLDKDISVGRYHSWSIDPLSVTDKLKITASSNDGHIMAIENNEMKLYGFQFHPESILTQDGETMIFNFMKMIEK